MHGQESVEQWKKFEVINYERSEGPSSDSSLHVDCRSVMFDLGRELQLHISLLLEETSYMDISFNTLFVQTQ